MAAQSARSTLCNAASGHLLAAPASSVPSSCAKIGCCFCRCPGGWGGGWRRPLSSLGLRQPMGQLLTPVIPGWERVARWYVDSTVWIGVEGAAKGKVGSQGPKLVWLQPIGERVQEQPPKPSSNMTTQAVQLPPDALSYLRPYTSV